MQTVTYSPADLRKLIEADLKKQGLEASKITLTATVKYGGTNYDPVINGECTGATVRVKS